MREVPPQHEVVVNEFRTLTGIQGPLLVVGRLPGVAFEEEVEVRTPEGRIRIGRVLEADGSMALVQVFGGTEGLDLNQTTVRFRARVARLGVSLSMLGRVMNGIGQPADGGPEIVPERYLDLNGLPVNPAVRARPTDLIQTGISVIDGLNTLVRGQKLPIFTGTGLPANRLAAQIVQYADLAEQAGEKELAIVFGAMGVTHREATEFLQAFESGGQLDRTIVFLNRADEPTIERLLTPRAALTAAEYLAFEHHRHVLVILTDMIAYCEALREVSAAREEVPGRRGYPAYMYSDLAQLYERAGRVRDEPGSLTQLVILTMPDDDITHPVPDLTGYITEGQLVLSRDLHQRGIFPPVNVLPSLSRLMDAAIGEGKTREDHRAVADQLYALYADGRDLRRLVAIIGEAALSEDDRLILKFADRFEQEFIHQGEGGRTLQETLELGWDLLKEFPRRRLKRVPDELLDARLAEIGEG